MKEAFPTTLKISKGHGVSVFKVGRSILRRLILFYCNNFLKILNVFFQITLCISSTILFPIFLENWMDSGDLKSAELMRNSEPEGSPDLSASWDVGKAPSRG